MVPGSSDVIDGPRYVDFRFAPPKRSILICRPGDRHRTRVDETGSLLYEDRAQRVVRFGIGLNERPIEVEQYTDDPRIPIVTTILRYRQRTLELLACGHRDSVGRRIDVVRWQLSANHTAPDVRPAAVHIEVVGDGSQPTSTELAMIADSVLYSSTAADLGTGATVRTAFIEPGTEPTVGSIAFFLDGPPFQEAVLDPDWAHEAFDTERRFWTGVVQRSIELRVPDRGIMDLLASSERNIVQGRPTMDPGSSMLGGHVLVEAAQFLGLPDRAREALDAVLQRAQPELTGDIALAGLEETAAVVATIVRQHELEGATELPTAVIEILRSALSRIGEMYDDREGGAPPPGGDGVDGARQEPTTLLWALAVLSMAGRFDALPPDLGTEAVDIEDRLRGVFAERIANDLHMLLSDRAATAVDALAHAIYPAEVFAPDDRIVTDLCALLEATEDEQGVRQGSDWPDAATARAAGAYAHVWLYCGRPDRAIDDLYALANHAAATGTWRETWPGDPSAEGPNHGSLPSSPPSAEFVRLVRNLLIFERGDELDLLGGVPPGWLLPGTEIVVDRTPTRFGRVSLRVAVNGAHEVHIDIDADWVRPPKRIVLHRPPATVSATVDGHPVDASQPSLVLRPTAHATVDFVLRQGLETVTDHAAVKAALRDWPVFSSAYPFKPDIRAYRQYPLEADGPAHDEYRAILTPWFHRRRIAELEAPIRAVATDLAQHLAAAGRVEAVSEVALPMVVRSLGVTLGRPQDVDEWLSWGVEINIVDGRRNGRGTDAYLATVFDEVALQPGEDVFTHIATSSFEGRSLTRSQRFGLGSMVLAAGRAAVVNLLSGAIWWLAAHPDERGRLAADPTLVPTAIEEFLRYLSPAPELDRMVTDGVHGFPTGSQVAISFVSANHDATVFPDPGTVDLSRRPNHHLAFGNGPHTCLGAHLGKLEARVLVEELLRIAPDFHHTNDPEIVWQQAGGTKLPRDFVTVPIGVR